MQIIHNKDGWERHWPQLYRKLDHLMFSYMSASLIFWRHFIKISFLIALSSLISKGQERGLRQLDPDAIKKWKQVVGGVISDDGKYAAFHTTLVGQYYPFNSTIKAVDGNWKMEFSELSRLEFSSDSRFAICMHENGKLNIQALGTEQFHSISDVKQYELWSLNGKPYILYTLKNGGLFFRDLNLSREMSFSNIYSFVSDQLNNKIYMVQQSSIGSGIILFDVMSKRKETLYNSTRKIEKVILCSKGDRFAFSDVDNNWFLYNFHDNNIIELNGKINNQLSDLSLKDVVRFTENGKLLIRLAEPMKQIDSSVNQVKVFSYQNPYAYSATDEAVRAEKSYAALYDSKNNLTIRIEHEKDKLKNLSYDGRFALIDHIEGSDTEYFWNKMGEHQDFILSLEDRKKVILNNVLWSKMSPDGKFVIGQSDRGGDLVCYDNQKKASHNLTNVINIPVPDIDYLIPMNAKSKGLEFYNWSRDGRALIVYDRYDIWQLDPAGIIAPINLTGGAGRNNKICFRFISNGPELLIGKKDQLIISAFNQNTKENGFYTLTIGQPSSLKKLTMGPYAYYAPGKDIGNWAAPMKAKYANIWLVPRQSELESPNFFTTSDFKTFRNFSNVSFEKEYQWFNTELFTFTTKDGFKCEAVLYKPGNLDKNKKYPVLFNYYQAGMGDHLHVFKYPGYTDHGMYFNFPMMLSAGYIICQTDIKQNKIGEPAQAIVNSVEGAADELAKRTYIDRNRFGAAGGSYGGYATNCLAALSKKFKALVSVSGASDLISKFSAIPGTGGDHLELRQPGIGMSLGTDPERYLRNSPITYTKRVTTPILIINTLHDGNVNVQQGIEWFVSLRREGKLAWMLQYQEDSHGVGDLNDQKDFYLRMKQFFDHYLKGSPAPIWMTKVMGGNDRGVTSGYEFDSKVQTPQSSNLLKH
ncbi:alpha/beta hydrolase family protein [Pararcticibacter amylolyticus]|uniref:Peptidase S9 prolyl oligopeptidase catalytic domain-containing protein n=1 Tax=Pararcticibacter amylolyticus TaxID=2173175 RepID=A0A2U2PHF8_9SPHI|nr:prolyl oligopeptidase family serine peptidase [Pararcticibacter amylolyticus]PWG80821.1 hypothetical protein DDR33_10210 [Pararcticibacter amylolyticus]